MAYIDTKDVKAIREALKAEFGKDFKFSVTREHFSSCLLYTSPSPRDAHESRMPSSA